MIGGASSVSERFLLQDGGEGGGRAVRLGCMAAHPGTAVVPPTTSPTAAGGGADAGGAAGTLTVRQLSAEGSVLVGALREVLDSLPAGLGEAGTRELARGLGVDKSLASRVLSALRAEDPLAALAQMPGPVPLRELLRAARKKGAAATAVSRAEAALEAYSTTLKTRFEDRSGLDAVLSAALPEARRRFEITARQAVFRGVSAIKGISTEVSSVSFVMHPGSSAETGLTDCVMIGGYVGMRRVRPDARMTFTVTPKPNRLPAPDGREDEDLHGVMLKEYCTPTGVEIACETMANGYRYEVQGREVGTRSSVNLFLAERYPRHMRLGPTAALKRMRRVGATIEIPTRRLVLDAVMHRSLWPGARMELRAYDTVFRGLAEPPAPERDVDLLPLVETVQELPGGVSELRSSRLPRYVELVEHVCGRMGWDVREFRAYRVEMQYPMYGAQVMMLLHAE